LVFVAWLVGGIVDSLLSLPEMRQRRAVVFLAAVSSIFLLAGCTHHRPISSPPLGTPAVTLPPEVHAVSATTALISWSTNVIAPGTLHYGIRENQLDQVAGGPWDGLVHNVYLKDLTANTTYYFRIDLDKNTKRRESILNFRTPPSDGTQK
jgi:hypothetical protein